jgi:hypothetical protein
MKKIIVPLFLLYTVFILYDGVAQTDEDKSQSLTYSNKSLPAVPGKKPNNINMPVMPPVPNVPQMPNTQLPNIPGRTGMVGNPMSSIPANKPRNINIPVMPPVPNVPQMPNTQLPNIPGRTGIVGSPMAGRLPNVPTLGNALGRITEINMEGDNNVGRIAVKQELSEKIVRMNIASGKTTVTKKTKDNKESVKMDVKDLKIGDIVSVTYNQEMTGELTATFINILSEDDLKTIRQEFEEGMKKAKEMLKSLASPAAQSSEGVNKEKSSATSTEPQ